MGSRTLSLKRGEYKQETSKPQEHTARSGPLMRCVFVMIPRSHLLQAGLCGSCSGVCIAVTLSLECLSAAPRYKEGSGVHAVKMQSRCHHQSNSLQHSGIVSARNVRAPRKSSTTHTLCHALGIAIAFKDFT
eukprot:6201642-Pleurochrysis_carterae.AAC.2